MIFLHLHSNIHILLLTIQCYPKRKWLKTMTRELKDKRVRIGFLVLSCVSTLNISISVVLFSSAAEAAATGTKAYIESSRFTGVSLVDTNDRSNSHAKTGGVEASSICSLSASGTSVSSTNDTSLRISSACEGVTWLAVVLGRA